MFRRIKRWYFRKRCDLINWLASDDIIVIINTATYDAVLKAKSELFPCNGVFRRNKVVNLDHIMETEVEHRIGLRKQGVKKSGNGFVLDPSLL